MRGGREKCHLVYDKVTKEMTSLLQTTKRRLVQAGRLQLRWLRMHEGESSHLSLIFFVYEQQRKGLGQSP